MKRIVLLALAVVASPLVTIGPVAATELDAVSTEYVDIDIQGEYGLLVTRADGVVEA